MNSAFRSRGSFRRAALRSLLLALLVLGGARVAVAARAVSDLASALEARVRQSSVSAERLGIAVLELGSPPKVVFARGHTQALPTASVAKVLTAAAALDLLGPGHVFTTSVTARGDVEDGVLHGDLVVHGSGDPNISGRLFGGIPTHVLDRFASAVRAAGIERIEGALVLDDGPFDRSYVHPDWSAADRGHWYGAPVGGLSFNDSCIDLVVRGGPRPGTDAVVDAPATTGPWPLQNRVETIPTGKTTVHAAWESDAKVLAVVGTAPLRGSYSFPMPVPDPVRFFGGAFAASLRTAGVRLDGDVRLALSPEDRRRGREIASHGSALSTSLRIMNRRSQNFYAGCLFKACGAALEGEGTWESGADAVDEMLRRRNIADAGRTTIVDGCGLSIRSQAPAATIALVLADFAEDLLRGPLLKDSLAVPGEEGTLDDRFLTPELKRRLHAKTGTLARSGVHALAGYLDGKDGHRGYAFAILVRSGAGARELIDAVVTELARP